MIRKYLFNCMAGDEEFELLLKFEDIDLFTVNSIV